MLPCKNGWIGATAPQPRKKPEREKRFSSGTHTVVAPPNFKGYSTCRGWGSDIGDKNG